MLPGAWCHLADESWSRLEEEGQQELRERQVLLPAYHSQTARIYQGGWAGDRDILLSYHLTD